VKELAKRGLRERLEKRADAPQLPYDFGLFEIVEEPLPSAEEPAAPTLATEATRRRLPIV
jgi:hypothetical protein